MRKWIAMLVTVLFLAPTLAAAQNSINSGNASGPGNNNTQNSATGGQGGQGGSIGGNSGINYGNTGNQNSQGQSINNSGNSRNTNRNTNQNDNTNVNLNRNSNRQSQGQGQQQGQRQGQGQSQNATGGTGIGIGVGIGTGGQGGSATQSQGSTTSENTQSTSTSVDASQGDYPRQAPPAFAPNLVAAPETCMGSSAFGASSPFGGLSFGTTYKSEACEARMWARLLLGMGLNDAATAYIAAMNPDVAVALKAAGVKIPAVAAISSPAPVASPVVGVLPVLDLPTNFGRTNAP